MRGGGQRDGEDSERWALLWAKNGAWASPVLVRADVDVHAFDAWAAAGVDGDLLGLVSISVEVEDISREVRGAALVDERRRAGSPGARSGEDRLGTCCVRDVRRRGGRVPRDAGVVQVGRAVRRARRTFTESMEIRQLLYKEAQVVTHYLREPKELRLVFRLYRDAVSSEFCNDEFH